MQFRATHGFLKGDPPLWTTHDRMQAGQMQITSGSDLKNFCANQWLYHLSSVNLGSYVFGISIIICVLRYSLLKGNKAKKII